MSKDTDIKEINDFLSSTVKISERKKIDELVVQDRYSSYPSLMRDVMAQVNYGHTIRPLILEHNRHFIQITFELSVKNETEMVIMFEKVSDNEFYKRDEFLMKDQGLSRVELFAEELHYFNFQKKLFRIKDLRL